MSLTFAAAPHTHPQRFPLFYLPLYIKELLTEGVILALGSIDLSIPIDP